MATLFFRSIGPSFTVHLQSLEALDAGGNEPRHTSFNQADFIWLCDIFDDLFFEVEIVRRADVERSRHPASDHSGCSNPITCSQSGWRSAQLAGSWKRTSAGHHSDPLPSSLAERVESCEARCELGGSNVVTTHQPVKLANGIYYYYYSKHIWGRRPIKEIIDRV